MHSALPPSGFRDLLISILRASVALRASRMLTTRTSLIYRRRAAAAARLAEAETDEAKMLPLIHQALSWIQLAENEEAIEAARTVPPRATS
jgi:hypothetical protein